MNCSPHDVRDYFLGELGEAARRDVESHVRSCAGCQEELGQLTATRSVLGALRDEEMPRRIAFVSDRVYEPLAMRRWAAAVWNSGPRLMFASAAMLSVAIVAGAWMTRPVIVPAPAPVAQVIERVPATEYDAAVVAKLIDSAVKASELKQAKQRETDIRAIGAGFEMLGKQVQGFQRAMYVEGSGR